MNTVPNKRENFDEWLEYADRLEKTPAFRAVIAALVDAGMLLDRDAAAFPRKLVLALADVLAAAEIEPRVMEVLPAFILKYPARITGFAAASKELLDFLAGVRAGKTEGLPDLGPIPAAKALFWVRHFAG